MVDENSGGYRREQVPPFPRFNASQSPSMNPTDLSRWERPGQIEFHTSAAGLTCLDLAGPFGTAQFFLQGAHLTQFCPRQQREMLFVSRQSHFAPGKAIRGGIPVIFPWFGPRDGHPESPMHGLVRTREWDLIDVKVPDTGPASVTFAFHSNEETLGAWPHPFDLQLQFQLGATLRILWEVRNTGPEAFTFEQALHPYFPVEDIHSAQVTGLRGASYLDKTAGPDLQHDTAESVQFIRETDRLYLDTSGPLTLENPAGKTRLRITKAGSQSSVVWNPWIAKAAALADLGDEEWQRFVCVEQVNAKHNAVHLPTGAAHTFTAEFSLETLP
jgi:glucose-6-phosphate 1-epimerase